MELSQEVIHLNRIKCHSSMQITLEEDVNVSDTKPDIDVMVKQKGEIHLTETKAENKKAILRGELHFHLLYTSQDDIRPVHSITGQIPFDEKINMEELTEGDPVHCYYELEDFQVRLINSRKISVRAIVQFHCQAEENQETSIGIALPQEEGVYQRTQVLDYTRLIDQKQDLFRIRDEIALPKGKPNIQTLLYQELTPQNLQTRLLTDEIRITGDMQVFLLYVPEDEERGLEYFETVLNIDDTLPWQGCNENQIPDIRFTPKSQTVEIKSDEDGEQRLFELELCLQMNMHLYADDRMDYLADAYSTGCQLSLEKKKLPFEKLLIKNQSSLRIADQIRLEQQKPPILQICSARGTVQIDDQQIKENGIELEGVIFLDILYMTESDHAPLANTTGMIPFHHLIEIKDLMDTHRYELQSDISQLSVILLDEQEIEAKVVIEIDVLAFCPGNVEVVTSFTEAPLDLEKLQQMPGVVGYIVTEDGTLWDLAKEYSTSIDSIMELNNLTTDLIHRGDKLLLAKQVSLP